MTDVHCVAKVNTKALTAVLIDVAVLFLQRARLTGWLERYRSKSNKILKSIRITVNMYKANGDTESRQQQMIPSDLIFVS